MATASFTCPECSAVLRTSNRIPAGKKIKCPKCSTIFAVPADEAEEVPASIQPPPRPAGAIRKARPVEDDEGVRPVRKAAPVDDYDDEPPVDDDRPLRKVKGKKKLKKAKSGNGLMIGLIAGGVLAVLIGGFSVAAWVRPGFLKSSKGSDEALAYLPADCNLVFGVDIQGLMADPTVAGLVQPLLAQAKNDPEVGRMKAETGLELEDILGRAVMGMKVGGAGGMGPPGMAPGMAGGIPAFTIVLQTRKAFDPDKVGKSEKNATAKKHNGKTYYAISTPPASAVFQYMPTDRLIVVSTLPEAQFQALLSGDSSKIHLSGDMQAMYQRVKDAQVWGVVNAADLAGGMGAPPGAGPAPPTAVGVAAKLQGDALKFEAFMQFRDAAAAQQLAGQVKGQMAGIGMIGAMMPKAKNALGDVSKNLQVSNDGPLAKLSTEVSRKSLEELIKGLQEGGLGGIPGMPNWLPGGGMPGAPGAPGGGFPPPPTNPGRGGPPNAGIPGLPSEGGGSPTGRGSRSGRGGRGASTGRDQ